MKCDKYEERWKSSRKEGRKEFLEINIRNWRNIRSALCPLFFRSVWLQPAFNIHFAVYFYYDIIVRILRGTFSFRPKEHKRVRDSFYLLLNSSNGTWTRSKKSSFILTNFFPSLYFVSDFITHRFVVIKSFLGALFSVRWVFPSPIGSEAKFK